MGAMPVRKHHKLETHYESVALFVCLSVYVDRLCLFRVLRRVKSARSQKLTEWLLVSRITSIPISQWVFLYSVGPFSNLVRASSRCSSRHLECAFRRKALSRVSEIFSARAPVTWAVNRKPPLTFPNDYLYSNYHSLLYIKFTRNNCKTWKIKEKKTIWHIQHTELAK